MPAKTRQGTAIVPRRQKTCAWFPPTMLVRCFYENLVANYIPAKPARQLRYTIRSPISGVSGMSVGRRLKAILIGSIGNLVEWYDFYAYTAFALYFANSFFPGN